MNYDVLDSLVDTTSAMKFSLDAERDAYDRTVRALADLQQDHTTLLRRPLNILPQNTKCPTIFETLIRLNPHNASLIGAEKIKVAGRDYPDTTLPRSCT